MFVALNSDSPTSGTADNFSFVLLTNVESGTTIKFTLAGWRDGTGFPYGSVYGNVAWVATTAFSAGTVIHVYEDGKYSNIIKTNKGSITSNLAGNNWELSGAGDQIIAFQGSFSLTASVIAGIHFNRDITNTTDANWDGNSTGNTTSALPDDLTPGVSAVWIWAPTQSSDSEREIDNMIYSGSVTSGTKEELQTAICNKDNWTTSRTTIYTQDPFPITFSVTGATPPPSISITSSTNVNCNGGHTGSITATVSDGAPNYNYVWSNGSTTTNTSSITNTISSLSAGTYSVTVTDDNGDTDDASVTITQPTAVIAAAVVDSNISCNAYADGGATASASGGTAPYSYAWSNGATTASITGIIAGTYNVRITDNNGCYDDASVTITQPTAIIAAAVVDSNISCNAYADGGATASASGGTAPYSYAWSNGATTASITGVIAGTYNVRITDNNGCYDDASVTITQPTALIAAAVVDSNISCNAYADGGATASASGGTAPYSYAWSNGATTASITGIIAGTYNVRITDNNGCYDDASVTITQPTAIIAAAVVDSNISCNAYADGGATASASGGTAPYSYAWSNGATTASITGVIAGTYNVRITDNNGCYDDASVTITQPTALIAAAVVDSNISCNAYADGGATASASGGTAPYSYAWSNGATTASIAGIIAGTYNVRITDNNGCYDDASVTITQPTALIAAAVVDSNISCNAYADGGATASASGGTAPYSYAWSNGATTASITGVIAGTYNVRITDNNGCYDDASVTITQPTALIAAAVVDSNISCNAYADGGATASASGGTAPYSYAWSNGATTASITGVIAGTYNVRITDNNGCYDDASVTITQPTALIAAAVVDSNISCNAYADGGATASASGGTAPYSYAWSNGATTASITGVIAGTYNVRITDNNGCYDDASVTITQPTALIAAAVVDSNISCNAYADGGATASASGGTAPYSYAWSNGATTASITGVIAGTYNVRITDNNGCYDDASVTITQPNKILGTDVQTACESYKWIDGNTYTESTNTPTHTVASVSGCDSVVTLDLTILEATTGRDIQSACESFQWIDGKTYTESNNTAQFTLTNAAGCDSVVTLDLTILEATTGRDVQSACESYQWIDGKTYTESNNTAQFTLTNAAGCDSVVTLDLTILEATTGTDVQLACESFQWIDGKTYTESNNTAQFTLTNAAGCDSVVTLDLTILEATTGTDVQSACESFQWIDGKTYTESNNTAQFTLTNAAGCDSVVTLDLTILEATTGTDVQSACESYQWIDGKTYTESNNTAQFTLTNAAGCDSVVTLDLTILEATTGTDVQSACESYQWIDGKTYTESNNTAQFTLTNAAGCDSVVTLDLTILEATTGTDVQSACESYQWIDGKTYTESNNTAQFTLTNAAGCDSVVTLDLTILEATTGTDVQSACESYQWIDGKTYTESNNTAQFTLTNAAGCDSVVTLDLTILEATAGTDIQSACESYQWIDGKTYTESNNTAQFTLTNAAGCDSVVTLDLTILEATTGRDVQSACESFQWIDGKTYTESNNTAQFTLTNAAGCDSVVTLDLTILEATTGTDVQSACESYQWIDGKTYTESNNTAQFTLTNAAGCDSVVTLDLTVVNIDTSLFVNGNTITSNEINATYQWINCDLESAELDAKDQAFTATASGKYAVQIGKVGCNATTRCVTITIASVTNNNFDKNIVLYPNPTKGEATLEFATVYREVTVILRDVTGKLISVNEYTNTKSKSIYINGKPGIYFIEINSEDEKAVFKIVKQ